MISRVHVIRSLLTVFSVLAIGCGIACDSGPKTPAETTARGFMEAYYVRADLTEASRLSDGLALDRVSSALMLREGTTIDRAAHQPKVEFKLAESRLGPEEADFFYEVMFRPDKADAARKKTRIKVRLRDGKWKVTQFSDHEL